MREQKIQSLYELTATIKYIKDNFELAKTIPFTIFLFLSFVICWFVFVDINVIFLDVLFVKKQRGAVFVLSCFLYNSYFIFLNVFSKSVKMYIVIVEKKYVSSLSSYS